MNISLIKSTYKKLRAQGYHAKQALNAAKTRAEWFTLDCGTHDTPELDKYCVRLRIVADECADIDDLKGDCYNPDVNIDISEKKLRAQEIEFEAHVNEDGVWGVIGEFWNGREWIETDSCFGFVGDDWQESGYDDDIKSATLAAYAEFRKVSELDF